MNVSNCSHCGAPLSSDASFCQSCGRATGVPQAPEQSPLEVLQRALKDRYRIERELGRGGMATVFLAHDLRHERDVAIKVLHSELAATVGPERFEREIKVSAKLQHPHILSLYDSGVAENLLFYVMPFVPGESLRERLNREEMLPLEDALTITLEVADALGYAHSLGIVHRDIKPENIMLSGGHALVADFGIARAMTGAAADQKLTQTGASIGTPLYMSPEQASGDEVGPTSDLYSLGCVAYEMLTGGPPFTGSNARAIMARHTMEMVPSLRVVRDTVPEHVEDAIFAVLSKVAADRPRTAAQFAEMLTGGQGQTAVRRAASRSRYTTAPVVPVLPAHRRRGVLFAAGAVLLVAGGAGWALTHQAGAGAEGGLDRRHLAVLYFDDLSADHSLGYLADGLTEGLIRALSRGGLDVVSRSGAALYRDPSVPEDSIARGLSAGTLVRGSVEPLGANVRVQFRLVDGASRSDIARGAFELPASNALAIGDSLVEQVARTVRSELGADLRRREQRQQTRSTDAWVLVQRAEQLRKQGDSLADAGDTVGYAQVVARADSQAAQAEALDRRWGTPITLRAALAYGRSRRYPGDPGAAARWIGIGLGHADRALAEDPDDPDALELRGNLRYWSFLLGLEPNAARAESLLVRARTDLEHAIDIEPHAGAYATLSHLYANDRSKRQLDVARAASEALRLDAFLGNAATIQTRLFFAWYDSRDSIKASESCSEGHRRFPDNPRFTECRLWLLTMSRQDPPAVRRAWALVDSLVRLTPPSDSAYQRASGNAITAAVLARAGLADSAAKVAAAVRRRSDVDPTNELAFTAAFVYALLDDKPRAVNELSAYMTANPQRLSSLAEDPGWWFRPLENDPAFQRLVRSAR